MVDDKPDLSRLRIERRPASSAEGTRRARTRTIGLGIAVGAAVLAAAGLLSGVLRTAVPVETATVTSVRPAQAATVLNASGYVVAERRADVASKATGRLVHLAVEEGTRVKKGDVLARLENADVEAALAEARAGLERARAEAEDARTNVERRTRLVEESLISQSDFDAAQARDRAASASFRAAQAAVRAAEVQLDYTVIRAPFDGTILTKNADVGEIVAPFGSSVHAKAAVVTMADMSSILVEVDVSESNVEKVRAGQPCEITLDAFPDSPYPGVVHMLVPTADRAKATVLTKVRFLKRDERVLPEMSAKVAFLESGFERGDDRPKTSVAPSAVVLRGGRRVAFKIDGTSVREVPVELGTAVGALVEVKSGLVPGEKVVINPPSGMKTGTRIKIAES